MPIDYCIDPERNLVLVEGHGTLSFDDLQEFRAVLVNDPLFPSVMKELADFRSVEEHDFTIEGFQQFLKQEKHYIDLLRDYQIAIVTDNNLHYGFARMYMARMNDLIPNVQVFRNIDEAKAWLLNGR
jgi:hypothetical protein